MNNLLSLDNDSGFFSATLNTKSWKQIFPILDVLVFPRISIPIEYFRGWVSRENGAFSLLAGRNMRPLPENTVLDRL